MIEYRYTREDALEFKRNYPNTPSEQANGISYQCEGNLIRTFEDSAEMVNFWRSKGEPIQWGNDKITAREMATLAETGDQSLVTQAEKLINKLEHESEAIGPVWSESQFGPILSVPKYLAGSETPFFRQREIVNDKSPLRIIVGISNSGGVGSEAALARGITILALFMKLQQVRPVELLTFEEGKLGRTQSQDYLYLTRVPNPVSLAHACVLVGVAGVATEVLYGLAYWEAGTVQWPYNYRQPGYLSWRAEALQLGPNDLFIDSNYYGDGILDDPVAWINKHLGIFNGDNLSQDVDTVVLTQLASERTQATR